MGNQPAFRPEKVLAAGLLFAVTMTVVGSPQSWADQKLRNLKRPVDVQLETPVQSINPTVGQPFAAKLVQPVHYRSWTLPAGTEFKGHVSKVGHSKHFGRPAYVILQTDSATIPSGQTLTFDPATYPPRNRALHDPNAETFFQSVGIQTLYSTTSAGVTVPLHYTSGVPVGPALIIGEGIRILTGAVFGLFRPKFKADPVPGKIAKGALDGSGIPRVVGFIGTYPEVDYHPGDTVKLYLSPKQLNDLFQASRTAALPKTTSTKATLLKTLPSPSNLSLAEPLKVSK